MPFEYIVKKFTNIFLLILLLDEHRKQTQADTTSLTAAQEASMADNHETI